MITREIDKARVAREREAHNIGLKRAGYERMLGHAKYLYRQKNAGIVGEIMRRNANGRILEIGSLTWVHWLERYSVRVDDLTCINVSEVDLAKGMKAAETAVNKPRFLLMDANELTFPDDTFDLVYGRGILHHLEFERALNEIRRVLKPGGVVVFLEPLGANPVAKVVRALTPRARTIDEQPLRRLELDICRQLFDMKFHYEQFFSVPAALVSGRIFRSPSNPVMRAAYALDEAILKIAPALGAFYRVVLLVGQKPRRKKDGASLSTSSL